MRPPAPPPGVGDSRLLQPVELQELLEELELFPEGMLPLLQTVLHLLHLQGRAMQN